MPSPCNAWLTRDASQGGMTANRRTRVRGVYGIDGTLGEDCTSSFFCNTCILMQEDREIRAREGQTNLRTCTDYNERAAVNLQPRTPQQMRYISPRETGSGNQGDDPNTSSRSESQQRSPNKLQKHYLPVKSNTQPTLTKGAAKVPGQANVSGSPVLLNVPSGKCGRSSGRQRFSGPADTRDGSQDIQIVAQCPHYTEQKSNIQRNPMDLQEGGEREGHQSSSKLEGGHSRSNGEENRPSKFKGSFEPSGKASASTSSKSDLGSKPSLTEKGPKSFLNSSVHDLTDSFKHESSGKEDATLERKSPSQEHTLIDCAVVAVDARSAESRPETILAEYSNVDSAIAASQKASRFDHTLTDCETIVVSEGRSPTVTNSSTQELSYVHDFTDCPVDKGILEYYEKEEEIAQAHAFEDCTRAGSKGGAVLGATQQHGFADCIRASSAGSIVLERAPQYSLPDCCRASIAGANTTQHHKLRDCKRPSSTMVALMVEIEQHELADCTTASSRSTVGLRGTQQDKLPDCCQARSERTVVREPQQHGLSDCTRSSSASAATFKKSQQHSLDDCTRSSSLSVLETRSMQQHDLCSQTSSTGGFQSNNPYVSHTHEMNECRGNQASDSSGNSESTIQIPQKKLNKGKQHANGQNSCQSCENVAFTSVGIQELRQLNTMVMNGATKDNKERDLHGLKAGSGTPKGRTYIADKDGGKSVRPSRPREHSAQYALAQVLAVSQKQTHQEENSHSNSAVIGAWKGCLDVQGSSGLQEKVPSDEDQKGQSGSGIVGLLGKMTGLANKGQS
jgi:hypothetical protein